MGVGPRLGSSSVHDNLPLSGNPDPSHFKIYNIHARGEFCAVEVHYPDCNNYEGIKLLVFASPKKTVEGWKVIDPHFSNKHPELAPIARFVPTELGWNLATQLVDAMSERAKKKHSDSPQDSYIPLRRVGKE